MNLESIIQVRITNDDLTQLKELAKTERLSISSYCRKELSKKIELSKKN